MKLFLFVVCVSLGVGALSLLYYAVDFTVDVDRTFLSIATFLFSIFTGFFISRQAGRYNKVRETVTSFDGKMSNLYRTSAHVGKKLQAEIGRVISAHYAKIFSSGEWDIHYTQKSTTLTEIHELMDKHVVEDDVTKISNQALGAMVKGLGACQDVRKQIVALREERIPTEQWILILFFAVMLLLTVSTVASSGLLFASVLKAAFVVSVLSVLFILYKLNNLIYSESIMGEHSAADVVALIEGSK